MGKTFGCDTQMTLAFLTKVEDMYVDSENPYHNNIHAADVIQGVHSILCHTTMKVALAELEIFSLLLAAVGHDIAHPGFTNDFMMNSGDDMALTYNDSSVNENMHCSVFCRLLQRPEYRFLQTLSSAQRVAVRKDIIHCILGTDMASHFRNFKIFTDLIQNNGTDLTNWDDMQPLQQATLHAADVANPTRPLVVAVEWTDRILTEFFHQGDLEREAGQPISPLCDRHNTSKPGSQVGFVDFIVGPTFTTFMKIDPEMGEQLLNLDTFKDHWGRELAKDDSCNHNTTVEK